MRLTYDADANAAFVYLREQRARGDVKWSHMCDVDIPETAIVLEFGDDDRLLGIEILGARKVLPPEVLDAKS